MWAINELVKRLREGRWQGTAIGVDAADALEAQSARVKELEDAYAKDDDEICQTLGKALGYPWFKDDQKNFPGATEASGVCVGEHVAASIASEAAAELTRLRKRNAELERERVDFLEGMNELDAVYGVLGTADVEGGEPAAHTVDCLMTELADSNARIASLEATARELREALEKIDKFEISAKDSTVNRVFHLKNIARNALGRIK